jgi:DNA-binding transcriptional regulator YiaG
MKNWMPEEINNLREKYKLSQPAFGKLLGVSGNYIYLLEKGVKNPSNTLKLLLECVAKQLNKNEKGKGGKKENGKRHLSKR